MGEEIRQRGAVEERVMARMIPARWEGAGAGLSWITMTGQRKENTYTHADTLLQSSIETITPVHAHTHHT